MKLNDEGPSNAAHWYRRNIEAAAQCEALQELLEETANMLRGMCMDPRIPQDTKEALWSRVRKLDTITEAALDSPTLPQGLQEVRLGKPLAKQVAFVF